jgi:fumarylacetoacetate (FAA) hydrolase
MKLASLNDGSRDGQLIVVSRDLALAHHANGIAGTLQAALDDWNFIAPQLEDLATTLNQGKARHAFPFDARQCLAPLPRVHQFAEAEATGGEPTMRRRAGDILGGPAEGGAAATLAPALATIVGDLGAGAGPSAALEAVRLIVLLATAADGDGGVRFAPLALTPDELGAAWHRGRAGVAIVLRRNGHPAARIEAAAAMPRHFGRLIAPLAAERRVGAGTLVGTGPLPGGDALAALQAGEQLEFEALGDDGQNLFGTLALTVRAAASVAATATDAVDDAGPPA